MKFWRLVGTSAGIFLCSTAISGFIALAALQATLLNKEVTKDWVRQSGLYQNLLPTLFPKNPEPSRQQSAILTDAIIQESLTQTFTPGYIQHYGEEVIDKLYAWLDGQTSAITFSIPIEQKQTELTNNLANLLLPQLAGLPPCTTAPQSVDATELTCLPPGSDPAAVARGLATSTVTNTEFLRKPLSEKDFTQPSGDQKNKQQNYETLGALANLPQTVQWAHRLLVILPILAVGGAVLAYVSGVDKYRTAIRLLRRISIGTGIFLAVGLAGLYVAAPSGVLEQNLNSASASTHLAEPLLRRAISGMSMAITVYAGIAFTLALGTLLVMVLLHRRRQPHPHNHFDYKPHAHEHETKHQAEDPHSSPPAQGV